MAQILVGRKVQQALECQIETRARGQTRSDKCLPKALGKSIRPVLALA